MTIDHGSLPDAHCEVGDIIRAGAERFGSTVLVDGMNIIAGGGSPSASTKECREKLRKLVHIVRMSPDTFFLVVFKSIGHLDEDMMLQYLYSHDEVSSQCVFLFTTIDRSRIRHLRSLAKTSMFSDDIEDHSFKGDDDALALSLCGQYGIDILSGDAYKDIGSLSHVWSGVPIPFSVFWRDVTSVTMGMRSGIICSDLHEPSRVLAPVVRGRVSPTDMSRIMCGHWAMDTATVAATVPVPTPFSTPIPAPTHFFTSDRDYRGVASMDMTK
jgi:hypothetical protein